VYADKFTACRPIVKMLPSADVLGEVDIIKVLNYRPTNSHEWLKTFPIFNDGTFVQVSIQIPQGSAATI